MKAKGFIKEININHNPIEVTSFGDALHSYIQSGPKTVDIHLTLTEGDYDGLLNRMLQKEPIEVEFDEGKLTDKKTKTGFSTSPNNVKRKWKLVEVIERKRFLRPIKEE